VPEPTSAIPIAMLLGGLWLARWRRKAPVSQ
jgi:hypothetical protein